MDNNHQFFIGREGGGGRVCEQPLTPRVMDMECGQKTLYGQPAGVVNMAANDNCMNSVIRMKEKDQVYTSAYLGVTGKQVQMPMKEAVQDMEIEDSFLVSKGTDLDGPVVDLASSRGIKTGGHNLPWTASKKVEDVQSPGADNRMFFYNDETIDMKMAKKKVIPAEARDESNRLVEMPEVRHKVPPRQKIPQKRPLLSFEDKDKEAPASPSVWIDTENKSLKAAASLIRDIENKRAKPQYINFNPGMFSGFERLEAKELMGRGAFGEVIKVLDVVKGCTMIQKKVKNVEKNEVLVLLQFPYQDSLARIFGFAWDGEDAHLVQEDAGISLRRLITQKDTLQLLDETGRVEKILLDVFRGISLLAGHGVTHCDIKPENVCLNLDTLRAKLIDLGSSKTSQDVMTYKGITPEYLPPAPNKFCYNFLVRGVRSIQAPRLGEKDDVWAGALIGLFLMMKAHPMIKWVAHWPDYPPNMLEEDRERLRNKVMEQISRLCDEPSLLPDAPKEYPVKDVLKQMLTTRSYTKKLPVVEELLEKVLVVDEDKRWSSADAVKFLQKNLDMVTQPPVKALRRCDSAEAEDIEVDDVDLKIAKNCAQQPQATHRVPSSPNQDTCPALGVALKPAATQQMGDIRAPANFTFQPPRQLAPTSGPPAAPRASIVAPRSAAVAPAAVVRQAGPRRVNIWEDDSEASEYENLVESFNVSAKVTPGPSQQASRYMPLQVQPVRSTATEFQAQSAAFAQRPPASGYQDMDISRRHTQNRNESSCMRNADPSSNSAVSIQGLFEGNTVVFRNGREVGQVVQQSEGNLPNMDALMSTSVGEGGDFFRPKLKGRRRNGPYN